MVWVDEVEPYKQETEKYNDGSTKQIMQYQKRRSRDRCRWQQLRQRHTIEGLLVVAT